MTQPNVTVYDAFNAVTVKNNSCFHTPTKLFHHESDSCGTYCMCGIFIYRAGKDVNVKRAMVSEAHTVIKHSKNTDIIK